MFQELEKINTRPAPFEFYTAEELWTDEYTSEQMLAWHLNGDVDISSRNADFIKRSSEWIISKFNIEKGVKTADFGCGPGLYTTNFARAGADVTGIDFSKRSIEYAKGTAEKLGLSVNYVNQNYLEFETDESFDLITMIMCDFCALSPEQRKQMLEKFHRLLLPGGSVLLDVYSLTSFDKREEAAVYEKNLLNGFWAPGEYYGFLNTYKYEEEKLTLDRYEIIEDSRTRTVYNWLQHFSPDTLEKEFTDSGFTIDNLYSDIAGSELSADSPEIAISAVKY